MSEFAVNLSQGLLAAHGQHRVPEGNQDAEKAEFGSEIVCQIGVLEKTECLAAEMKIVRSRQGYWLVSLLDQGERRPTQQNHYHDGRDLHYLQSFFAGLVDSFCVLPPKIEGNSHGEDDRGPVDIHVGGAVKQKVHGSWNPAMRIGG